MLASRPSDLILIDCRNTLGDLMKRVFVPGHSGKRDVSPAKERSDTAASGDSSTDDERRKDAAKEKEKEKRPVKPLNLKAAEIKKGVSKSPISAKCTFALISFA